MKRLKGQVIDITQDGYAIIKVAVNLNEIMHKNVKDCYVTFADDLALPDSQEYINLTAEQCAVVYDRKKVRETIEAESSVIKKLQSGLRGQYAGIVEKPKNKKINLRTMREIEICLNCPFPDCKKNCERIKERIC